MLMTLSRQGAEGSKWRKYSWATASRSRRFSRSTVASAGFTSWVVRILTSTKNRTLLCYLIRSISPRRGANENYGRPWCIRAFEEEIGVFFTAPADTQVLSDIVGRQRPACDSNQGCEPWRI
jgi:hypothetical protein